MQLSVQNIELKNIGQTVSFDYDPNGQGQGDTDLMRVKGILEGHKERPAHGEYVLTVAGEEFTFNLNETVEMQRSAILSRLHYMEMNYFAVPKAVAEPALP